MTDTSENSKALDIYRRWAFCDMWPLEDAVVLVSGGSLRDLGATRPAEPMPQEVRVVYELALNCAGHTLRVERSEVRNGELMVEPGMFVAWFEQRLWEIPAALRQALSEVRDAIKESYKTRDSKLRPDQQHRERTRGVAAYLWSQDPTIRIGTMVERHDLWAITCEGSSYNRDTVHSWLQDVAPPEASKPGAPRKNPRS